MLTKKWDRRLARVAELLPKYPAAEELLTVYSALVGFQLEAIRKMASQILPADGCAFADRLLALRPEQHFAALLVTVETHAPAALVAVAHSLRAESEAAWRQRLADLLCHARPASPEEFLAMACLQPAAELLAANSDAKLDGYTGSVCPICGAPPLLAILRPEGDGGRRSLLCSLCATEWTFRRILCAACGETNYRQLPHFDTADFPQLRIDACDTCHRYLKTVDTTVDGHAVPEVDEIAAAALDLWAHDRGYSKIAANIVGI